MAPTSSKQNQSPFFLPRAIYSRLRFHDYNRSRSETSYSKLSMADSDNLLARLLSSGDEQISESESVAALILSSINDPDATVSLEQIYSALSQSRSEAHLDPLSTLPHLLSSHQPFAKELISLMGECGSAKEVVIAVQEVLERIERSIDMDEDEEANTTSPPEQLISLIHLYNSAIPRLKLRKKTPSETIRPLLSQLQSTIQAAAQQLNRDQGREIISTVALFSSSVLSWAAGLNSEDIAPCNEILLNLLDTTISACSHCISSSLAQRSFEALFPRLTIRSTIEVGWEDGEKAISDVLATYSSLGRSFDFNSLPSVLSSNDLILLAHSKTLPTDTNRVLSAMLPVLIASIQSNSALDEALSILLQTLQPSKFKTGQLSPDVAVPLCVLLPSVASAHPDQNIRHQAFRILSSILSLTPPELRIQMLKELTGDVQFPQMRVAAVGLVKEAALEFLSRDEPSIFASPMFLQILGPTLLRPDPVDLFNSKIPFSDMQDSSEPSRLVECLALYYILLLRDKRNRTGIRDSDQISNVEKGLLAPLRSTITRWMEDPAVSDGHMHAIMPLVSLKTSLERVDAAIADLRSASTG